GWSPWASPNPSEVMISPPAMFHAGIRQAFTAVHSVAELTPGSATRTAHAPHSPSAQPSLAPVRPSCRSQSNNEMYGATALRLCARPLIRTVGASMVCDSSLLDCICLLPLSGREDVRASLRVEHCS